MDNGPWGPKESDMTEVTEQPCPHEILMDHWTPTALIHSYLKKSICYIKRTSNQRV